MGKQSDWLFSKLIPFKLWFAYGGGFLTDGMVGGFIAGTYISGQYATTLILLFARVTVGAIFWKAGWARKESELNTKMLNSYWEDFIKRIEHTEQMVAEIKQKLDEKQ